MKEFIEKLKSSGGLLPVILCLVTGVILIIAGGTVGNRNADAVPASSGIEQSIKNLCEKVNGVSDVTVAVSLSDSGTGRVNGVGIVCRGGGDPTVQRELISLVSSVYGVSPSKIFITEAQK